MNTIKITDVAVAAVVIVIALIPDPPMHTAVCHVIDVFISTVAGMFLAHALFYS